VEHGLSIVEPFAQTEAHIPSLARGLLAERSVHPRHQMANLRDDVAWIWRSNHGVDVGRGDDPVPDDVYRRGRRCL